MTVGSPTRYHFVEPGTPPRFTEIIRREAPRVWEELTPLPGGPLLCINALSVWPRIFDEAGEPCKPLNGWYQEPEGPQLEHSYFALGSELWLFDPTAAQFSADRAVVVERGRYLVRSAEFAPGIPFEQWRADRLAH